MAAAFPVALAPRQQAHIGLVQERRRFQRVVAALAAHQGARQLAQVWQNQAEEPLFDAPVTCAPNRSSCVISPAGEGHSALRESAVLYHGQSSWM